MPKYFINSLLDKILTFKKTNCVKNAFRIHTRTPTEKSCEFFFDVQSIALSNHVWSIQLQYRKELEFILCHLGINLQ